MEQPPTSAQTSATHTVPPCVSATHACTYPQCCGASESYRTTPPRPEYNIQIAMKSVEHEAFLLAELYENERRANEFLRKENAELRARIE